MLFIKQIILIQQRLFQSFSSMYCLGQRSIINQANSYGRLKHTLENIMEINHKTSAVCTHKTSKTTCSLSCAYVDPKRSVDQKSIGPIIDLGII